MVAAVLTPEFGGELLVNDRSLAQRQSVLLFFLFFNHEL